MQPRTHVCSNPMHDYVHFSSLSACSRQVWMLEGAGFGRLEGRWKGRGHTRLPLGEGTFGAVWDRHVFKGTSSTTFTSFLFRPLLVNSVTIHSHTFSNLWFWCVPWAKNLVHLYYTQSVLLFQELKWYDITILSLCQQFFPRIWFVSPDKTNMLSRAPTLVVF